MNWLLYIVFLFKGLGLHAQLDTVILSVDVLGQDYPHTSYHHPVNGKYLIKRNELTTLTKEQLRLFVGHQFINPTAKFKEGKNYVQGNSLRYYINVNEIVYLQWDSAHRQSNINTLELFRDSTEQIRKEKYSEQVQSYFNPFFIHRTEVTNYQYRQFVNWVRDSLLMEEIFLNYPDFTKAKQLIVIPDEAVLRDTSDRVAIRKKYHLNFESNYRSEKYFKQTTLIPIISKFYLSPSSRWYKRKEIDVRLLNYSNKVEEKNTQLNVYPVTTKWYKDHPQMYNDPMANMYFWHPAYDNFPVVGVTKEQAESYCVWKEQQFRTRLGSFKLPFDIKFELPNTKDYENTIRYDIGEEHEKQIEDNQLVTDLQLLNTKLVKSPIIYSYQNDISVFLTTNKVYIPSAEPKNRKQRKTIARFTESGDKKSPYDKELHDLMMQRVMNNYIESGMYFLSNNVSEWMTEDYETNYEALSKAYINYNCFSSIDYCEGQRIVDEKHYQKNNHQGNLILGGNWYDERYGSYLGVNKAGLYPKSFKSPDKSFATVGFRYVIRIIPS